MSNCHCNSNINQDGSGQLGRYLKALDPAYAPIDDRRMEDLLVFAKRYAGQIRFYDVPDSVLEDQEAKAPVTWREFFRRDMAVIAASIATINLAQIQKDYDEIRASLAERPTGDVYAALFTNILGMAARMDGWYGLSLPEYPLRKDLDSGIVSSLRPAMQQLKAYEQGYVMVDGKHLKLDYSAMKQTALWGLDEEVLTDATIYTGATTGEKLMAAALFVDDLFLTFYNFLKQLVAGSAAYLEFALEHYPAHQPHMALFIAFLELFRLAQDQMNGLTGRMLEFYYRDVLQLSEGPSIPDRVHLIFELAKDVTEYDLEQSTALLAGKDASGKELVYKTETALTVNSARVKELKTLFIQKKPGATATNSKIITAFYAKPVANSEDGYGAKFTVANPKWPALGAGWPVISDPRNICEAISAVRELGNAPQSAQVGFAIASPQLLLQGGKRLLKIDFGGLETLAAYTKDRTDGIFDIYLTADQEWLLLDQLAATSEEIEALATTIERGVFDPDTIDESGYFLHSEEGQTSLFIYLPVSAPPVIAFDEKIHTGSRYDTKWPVLKILLRSAIEITEADYNALKYSRLSIDVKVGSINDAFGKNVVSQMDGLKTLVLQNDTGLLDPAKPFDPFTAYPAPGKSLYIGSSELFNKPLGEVGINFRKTQDELNGNESGDDNYDYRLKVLDHRQWVALYSDNSELFTRMHLSQNVLRVRASGNATTGEFDTLPYAMKRTPLISVKQWDGKQEKGFLRIDFAPYSDGQYRFDAEQSRGLAAAYEIKELSVSYYSQLSRLEAGIDQLFHVYPFGIAEVGLPVRIAKNEQKNALVAATRMTVIADGGLLNAFGHLFPQFTFTNLYNRYLIEPGALKPQDSNLSGQMMAGEDYDTEWISQRFPKKADQLMLEASGLKERESGRLNQYSGLLQEEGMLFIGLEKAKPLQTVSLLFQFAEGSAMDEDNDPPVIHWTYLVNNEWRSLKAEYVLSDDTYGFQTTGIIQLEIPDDASAGHSIITDGLLWFGVSVSSHSDRIPQLVNVVAQAVLARFEDNDHASAHFDSALPAGSISKLAVAATAISKVVQPFASFDGKPRAQGTAFYTQVSERLRHKGRAVNSWDYEHLVLDRFPSVYKVKCIQHTDPDCLCREPVAGDRIPSAPIKLVDPFNPKETYPQDPQMPNEQPDTGPQANACCGPQVAPGHVLIVPIANLRNRNAANPLQPKTSRRTLLEIQDYLKKKVSPFVHIHARNPVYEQIMVFFRVQFYAGTDKGFFLRKLNDDIVRYLTPWAFDEQADVVFGQKVYASAVINFIEERPYVDFITDFVMDVCLHDCCPKATAASGQSGNGRGQERGPADLFQMVQGCDDMEALISSADFTGYVVATPSTARSILVSAAQHIIIPYEAPAKISPCEQRKVAVPIPMPAPEPQPQQPRAPIPEKDRITLKDTTGKVFVKEKPAGDLDKVAELNTGKIKDALSEAPAAASKEPAAGKANEPIVKDASGLNAPIEKTLDPSLKKVSKTIPKKPGK